MKVLTEADVIGLFREEWKKRIDLLENNMPASMTAELNGKDKIVISPELKVVHKGSKLRYTVQSVGPRSVILRTPEGNKFLIDAATLENEYEIS